MRLSIYSIVVIACTIVYSGVVPVEAGHSSNSHSHARKSLNWRHGRSPNVGLNAAAFAVGTNQKRNLQMVPRQGLGVGAGLGDLGLGAGLDLPDPNDGLPPPPPAPTDETALIPAPIITPPGGNPTDPTPTDGSSTSSSTSSSGSTSATESNTSSTSTTASDSTETGSGTETGTETETATNTIPPDPTEDPSTPPEGPPTPPPTPTEGPDPDPTETDGGGILPSLSLSLSVDLPTLIPPTPSDTPPETPTDTGVPPDPTPSGTDVPPTDQPTGELPSNTDTGLPPDPTASDPEVPPTQDPTDPGGPLPSLSLSLSLPLPTGDPTDVPSGTITADPTGPTDDPTGPTGEPTGDPTDSGEPTSPTDDPTGPSDTVTDEPTGPSDTVTGPSDTITGDPTGPTDDPSGSITDGPSDTFPTISFPGSPVDSENDTDTTTTKPVISTVSLESGFTFLTESSLVYNTETQDVPTPSATDPDALPTAEPTGDELPDPTADAMPATTLSDAPLPTGMPARIYPRNQIMPGDDLTGYTLISILFDQRLNWRFVTANQVAASQIFGYLPVIIAHCLGISGNEVKTFALQVYVPHTYRGPQDVSQLGTVWLGYIPQDLVDTLAAEIKAKQSSFYTGVADPVARDLVNMINSGFALDSVADPNNIGGDITGDGGGSDGGSGHGSGSQTGATTEGKTRQDAIIGVVTALGTVAVLVLVFLVYRSWKRRQDLKHRRMSDPPAEGGGFLGVRPEGRDFDQDSLGGARRRSFYFAEDSLRDQQLREQAARESRNPFDDPVAGGRSSPMMTRRNVTAGVISAPVLKESSMNW